MNLLTLAGNYKNGLEILRDWVGGAGRVVDNDTAQKRADICIDCPENKPSFLTEAVANAIKSHLEFKADAGLHVVGESELHSCQICSCANRLSVWCPSEFLSKYQTPEEISKYPAACWKTKL